MKSIRLGIIFDQTIKRGGGYQQALNSAMLTKKLFCLRRLTIFMTGAKYAASEKLTFIYDTVYSVFNKLHQRQWVEVVALM